MSGISHDAFHSLSLKTGGRRVLIISVCAPDRALTLEEQERPVLLHPQPWWLHYCQSRGRWMAPMSLTSPQRWQLVHNVKFTQITWCLYSWLPLCWAWEKKNEMADKWVWIITLPIIKIKVIAFFLFFIKICHTRDECNYSNSQRLSSII